MKWLNFLTIIGVVFFAIAVVILLGFLSILWSHYQVASVIFIVSLLLGFLFKYLADEKQAEINDVTERRARELRERETNHLS